MEEKRSNWGRIILTAIITAVVTVGGGMLITIWQADEPHLTYSTEDAIPFEGQQENIAIYNVKIENDGEKVVEDVVCQLSFSTATIEQSRLIIEPTITKNVTTENNMYRLELPDLNAKESAIISVLASSPEQLPSRPDISLRGKDVTGVEASTENKTGDNWIFVVLATIAVYAIFSILYLYFRKDSSKHRDDQRQILSYLCGIHKLNAEVERYLNMPSKTSYWSESDRFAALASKKPKGAEAEKRKHVLKDLLKYAYVHKSSRGIVHYNIARIAKAQGKKKEADVHLKQAKDIIPKLIETRIKLDPIWKKKKS